MFPNWITSEQAGALERHLELLERWNKTLNLTRITDRAEAIERHYNEALFVARHLPPGALRIVDIGSGAGFPGLPIAIVRPECSVSLIESHQRKAVFLREASRDLRNVKILPIRAEACTERFDWAVSRAVAYADLEKCLVKLADQAALLTGAEEPPTSLGFQWEPAIGLPGSIKRFLRKSVSRETLSRA
ncbi:MAG TPA: 16S rRNA (guanine(527)-N(7))-methyltransferase RsmG [Bryobacteraceae bacterium]